MSKRNKSRLTKADLGNVLKLQQDYDNLCSDIYQFMLFILDYKQNGIIRRNINYSNCNLNFCHREIYESINEGKFKWKEETMTTMANFEYSDFCREMDEDKNRLFSRPDILLRLGRLNHRDFKVATFLEQYATERDGIVYVPMFRVLDALIQDGKPYTEW